MAKILTYVISVFIVGYLGGIMFGYIKPINLSSFIIVVPLLLSILFIRQPNLLVQLEERLRETFSKIEIGAFKAELRELKEEFKDG